MNDANITSVAALYKDMYPRPGDRIKQWVVDVRREDAWERETCPRVFVPKHDDNTGLECRNEGPTIWTYLAHDCCSTCCEMHEHAGEQPEIQAWLEEKSKRPPIEKDRTKLSDVIQEDYSLRPHPMLREFKDPDTLRVRK